MSPDKKQMEQFLVEEFARESRTPKGGGFGYRLILSSFLGLSMLGGIFLSRVDLSRFEARRILKKMDVSFLLEEKKPEPPKPEPKPKEKKKPKVKKPIEKASVKEEIKTTAPKPQKAPRKVYGVSKVYSKGLGTGGTGSEALVAKMGNSLDVPPDTIKATEADLKGQLVSVTRISQMPKITFSSKPEYTSEMRSNNVNGKVKARVLVDVDGQAKQIIILQDLGYGTRESSIAAIQKMKFKPGILNDAPVAVWIPLTFRFELQA